MGYYEALEDGIPITESQRGFSYYHPPCHICGAPTSAWRYIRGHTYTCEECRTVLARLKRAEEKEAKLSQKKRRG